MGSHSRGLRAVGLNTIAFSLTVAVQQLAIFPYLARTVEVAEFSRSVLLITLSTIVVNVLAGEVANVTLVRSGYYEKNALPWDSGIIVGAGVLVVSASAILLPTMGVIPWSTGLLLGGITILAMVRTLGVTPDKYQGQFHLVVLTHSGYAIGALFGLLFARVATLMPFLMAELMAFAVLVAVRRRHRAVDWTLRPTVEFSATLKRFLQLGLVAVLMNMVSYLDRLLIMPLLGATALGVYYSTSALAKSLALVTNPVANAYLANFGRRDEADAPALFRAGSLAALPALVGFLALSAILSYFGLAILYPGFFDDGIEIILPVALAAAFASASDLLRPLLMRFLSGRRFLAFNFLYAGVYTSLAILFCIIWGLIGFAWSAAIARAILFVIYWVQSFVKGRSS